MLNKRQKHLHQLTTLSVFSYIWNRRLNYIYRTCLINIPFRNWTVIGNELEWFKSVVDGAIYPFDVIIFLKCETGGRRVLDLICFEIFETRGCSFHQSRTFFDRCSRLSLSPSRLTSVQICFFPCGLHWTAQTKPEAPMLKKTNSSAPPSNNMFIYAKSVCTASPGLDNTWLCPSIVPFFIVIFRTREPSDGIEGFAKSRFWTSFVITVHVIAQ